LAHEHWNKNNLQSLDAETQTIAAKTNWPNNQKM